MIIDHPNSNNASRSTRINVQKSEIRDVVENARFERGQLIAT
jgi:hypothetical protein